MLSWFGNHAPIRLKFKVLFVVHGVLCGAAAGAACYAALHAGGAVRLPVMAVAIGAFLATLATVALSSRLICKPYVDTVVRMEALAAGDVDSEIAHTGNRDCVGRMTKALGVFRASAERVRDASDEQRQVMDALGAGLVGLAEGDLVHQIDTAFPADYEKLRADFNNTMTTMAEAMRQVSHAAGGIHTGAAEIRQASDDLSQRTEQQAASLEQTAAAMDEITSTVRRTAEDATRANGAVEEARSEARHSGEVVARAVEAMGGIERSSSEISEIITVIDGIAFQTNLLALNAGVEAARAGDAGKGFAVVASEVRALAQRSAEAAKDVKTRILASAEQVEAGVELVSETGKALERIIARIGEISALVAAIAGSAEQQASGLAEVNTAVAEMDSVTQQNAAMVEEATAAARSLASEADELARQMARFRTGEAAPAARPAVHALQDRARDAARRLARPAPRAQGNTALAVEDDGWSEF